MLCEQQFIDSYSPGGVTWALDPSPPAGERVLNIRIEPNNLPATQGDEQPQSVSLHTDVSTGLLTRVTVGPTSKAKAYDAIVTTPADGPPLDLDRPEAIGLPADVALVDNRPTPEVRKAMANFNDIVRSGAGIKVGVMASRWASPTSGEFSPDLDEMTICAGTASRFVIATWVFETTRNPKYSGEPQHAPRPAGWPKPTPAQAIAAVAGVRPNQFFVFDGKTLWISDSYASVDPVADGTGRSANREPGAAVRFWARHSIAGRLWGTFLVDPPTPRTRLTLAPSPVKPDQMILEAITESAVTTGRDPAHQQTSLQTIRTQRLTYWPNLGPYPLKIETTNRVGAPADPRFARTFEVDIDPSAGWMFRDPVRVPQEWRTLALNESDLSYTRYDRLIPALDNTDVPAEWYADPAITWPRAR